MYKIIGTDQKEYGLVTAEQLRQWIGQGRIDGRSLAKSDGATEWKPLGTFPELAVLAPPPLIPRPTATATDNALATIIPYRNAPALTAYYCAVFSLIPVLGLPLAMAAVILGIFGLRRARANPGARGGVHAWIGIILGGLITLLYLVIAVIIIARASRK